MSMSKVDYAIAALIGFFIGIFAIPTLFNLGIRNAGALLGAPWVGMAAGLALVLAAGFAARYIAVAGQFGRFGIVGLLNTVVDFGILNLLSRTLGITAGIVIGGVNIPGFLVAVANSYFWNKLWVFRDRDKGESLLHDFPKFFAVTVGGSVINSGIIIVLTTYILPPGDFSAETWLNVAKGAATAATLFWNFAGYKFVVFRSKTINENN